MGNLYAIELTDSYLRDTEGHVHNATLYSMSDQVAGFVGDELPDSGYLCEFMGAADGSFACHSASEIVRLKTDNAKLRELVRDMWEGYMDPPCEGCQLKDTPTCADCPICAREAMVIDRMRELGVEVGQ